MTLPPFLSVPGRLQSLVLLLLSTVPLTLWSLATPQWTTPDAPAHETMAYSVGHGELWPERSNEFGSGVTSNAIVRVPAGILESAGTTACTAFQSAVPASCLAPVGADETPAELLNPAGRNIPTYYLLTGWPSLLTSVEWSMVANRAAALVLAALFLAWTLSAALASPRRGAALVGCGVACTPMAMYMGANLNPNSAEIFAALAMAASSLAAAHATDARQARVFARRAAISAALMVSVRMLAPAWLVLWCLALLVGLGWPACRELLRRMGRWTVLPVVAVAAQAAWTMFSGIREVQATPKFDLSLIERLDLARHHIGADLLRQQIGIFGWLDTPLAPDAYARYVAGALIVLTVLLLGSTPRVLASVVGLGLAVYSAPVLLEALQWNMNGPVWQGRYTLPLTVMLPVMAAMGQARAGRERARPTNAAFLSIIGLLLLASTHVVAYLALLRRNTSGINGDTFDGPWETAVTNEVAFAVFATVTAITVLSLALLLMREGGTPLPRALRRRSASRGPVPTSHPTSS